MAFSQTKAAWETHNKSASRGKTCTNPPHPHTQAVRICFFERQGGAPLGLKGTNAFVSLSIPTMYIGDKLSILPYVRRKVDIFIYYLGEQLSHENGGPPTTFNNTARGGLRVIVLVAFFQQKAASSTNFAPIFIFLPLARSHGGGYGVQTVPGFVPCKFKFIDPQPTHPHSEPCTPWTSVGCFGLERAPYPRLSPLFHPRNPTFIGLLGLASEYAYLSLRPPDVYRSPLY